MMRRMRVAPRLSLLLRHPFRRALTGVLGVLLVGALPACATAPVAQAPASGSSTAEPGSAPAPVARSTLDAQLFYELVVAEMLSGQDGDADPGTGFALMLKAAQREQDPALFERAVELAMAARAGGSVKQALQAWLQVQPESTKAHRQWLHLQLGIGSDSEIAQALLNLLRVTAPEQQRLMVLGVPTWLSQMRDQPQRRLSVAEQGLAEALQNPRLADNAHAVLAQLQLLAGQPQAALASTQSALQINASSQAAGLMLVALFEAKQIGVLPQMLNFLRQHPDMSPVQLAAARALAGQNRTRLALQTLQPLAQQPKAQAEVWLLLGQLQAAQNAHRQSSVSVQRFIDALPASQPDRDQWLARGYLLLSGNARQQARYAEAMQWLDRIPAAAVPEDIDYREAQILVAQGQLDQALVRLARAPRDSEALQSMRAIERVRILEQGKAYQRAYDELMQARQAFPDMHDWLYEQAMLAEKLNRLEDMERWLRELIRQQPDEHHALNALGYALADRNLRLDEAQQLIAQALEMVPGDPFVTDSMGWVLYRKGQLREALVLLQDAWDSRADVEIAAHLGEVLWQLGERVQAREVWAQGKALQADHAKLVETMQRLDAAR